MLFACAVVVARRVLLRFGGLDRCDGSLCDGELLGFKCVGVLKLWGRPLHCDDNAVLVHLVLGGIGTSTVALMK